MINDTHLEAQRLVNISISKMTQPNNGRRTSISLHKSLLVATVLEKAKLVCMEDILQIDQPTFSNVANTHHIDDQYYHSDDLPARLSSSENNIFQIYKYIDESESNRAEIGFGSKCKNSLTSEMPVCLNPYKSSEHLCSCEHSTTIPLLISWCCKNTKRKREYHDAETEEAVQSILPKKMRLSGFNPTSEDSVLDDKHSFCNNLEKEHESSMDVDKITSLVSIFSFKGVTSASSSLNLDEYSSTSNVSNSYENLTRSASTPDMCSSQANINGSQQQSPFLTMAV